MFRPSNPKNNGLYKFLGRVPWAGVVITTVAGVVVYGFYRDDPSESANEFLYRWQTGLAGIGAVLAAYLTVYKMERTDANAERRHRDLIALQMQSARVTTQRAFSQLEALLPIPTRDPLTSGWFSTVPHPSEPRGADRNPWRSTLARMKQIIQSMMQTEFRPDFIDLDGKTEWAEALLTLIGLHQTYLRKSDHAAAIIRGPMIEEMKQLIGPEVDRACDRVEKAIAKVNHNFPFANLQQRRSYTLAEPRWILEDDETIELRMQALDSVMNEISREMEELGKIIRIQLERYPASSFDVR